MRKLYAGFAIAGAIICATIPCLSSLARTPDQQAFAVIERGRYLVTAADCTACHTNHDGGAPFAGGRSIETPFGNVISANITPDKETGIGAWTDDDFDEAVRNGVRPDGSRLYPAMPYTSYTKMTRDDVKAMFAYLKTIAPVHNKVESDTLPFPLSIRFGMRIWDFVFFKSGQYQPDSTKSAEWNRGAYLVQGPGHCGACHTPKNFAGADKSGEYLRGANLQAWFAPDITNDNRRGLGRWSIEQIVNYLKTGHNAITGATGRMSEEIAFASSHISESDLKAIATYLKSLPGRNDEQKPIAANDPQMQAGAAIYRDQCSACHGLDGKGTPNLFPALANSSQMRSDDPSTLLRIILRGGRSVATDKEPTSPGMPSFAWQLSDTQIAAVATYIRNAWGSAAAPVSAGTVSNSRGSLASRTSE
jgi:mono/diheme cytochrome c family protein